MFDAESLRTLLALVGQLLAERGHAVEIVVVGGGALVLSEHVSRATEDIDPIAVVVDGEYRYAVPLPSALSEAAADAGQALGVDPGWIDLRIAEQLKQGLPAGFASRTRSIAFGGLTVHFASRVDQICLKLYAASDQGLRNKHVADLVALAPDANEWRVASDWVKRQDTGPEFGDGVDAVIAHVEALRGAR